MRRSISQRIISALLGLALVFSLPTGMQIINAQNSGVSVNSEITPEMRDAYNGIKRSLGLPGMRGFDGDSALPEGDDPVSVIVLFKHQPAATQQVEAAVERGRSLPQSEAESLAEADHTSFKRDLETMFPSNPLSRSAALYEITSEYRKALNGVAMKIPADKVKEISEFSSVYAVYPNNEVYLDPIEKGKGDTVLLGNKSGNAEGRDEMNADELHAEGITGEGVEVCVIDTGVDYNHPDLEGAFGTVSPSENEADLLDGKFYGRNFVEGDIVERASNDPMETTYDEWQESGMPEYDERNNEFYTYHGSHVSGTVVSRGVNNEDNDEATSSLGIAPGATLYVYRVFGAYNRSTDSSILDAIEYVAIDKPDIVNMSLGNSLNNPYYLTNLAVNNIMIANEGILFVISTGNSGSGMFTTGSPVGASAAIGVGNATVTKQYTNIVASMFMDYGFDSYTSDNNLGMFYMNEGGGFTYDDETKNWRLNYEYAICDSDGNYEAVYMPNISLVEDIYSELGVGTAEEFEALAEVTDIEGKIIVLRRGANFVETMALAKQYNAGAIILINRDEFLGDSGGLEEFRGYGSDYLPFLVAVEHYSGMSFFYDLQSVENKFEFSNIEDITLDPALHFSSSRGPVLITYDIKPDLVSHGENVLSTVPRMGDANYDDAYLQATGTSMASPNVTGAAALLKSANPEWTAKEIKIRLMNTAKKLQPVTDILNNITEFGVYEQGAGFVDVLAALNADTVVSAEYDSVITSDALYMEINETSARDTGSLNFGSLDVNSEEAIEIPLNMEISNRSDLSKDYTISYYFNTGGQLVNDAEAAGVSLSVNGNVTVAENSAETVTVTLNAPANMGAWAIGSYEGYVTVSDGENEYNLPFAAYARITEPPLKTGNYFVNRPVISTSPDTRQNQYSSGLDFFVNISKSTLLNFYVVDPAAEITKAEDGTVDIYELIDQKALTGELTYVDLSNVMPGEWVFINNIVYNGEYSAYAKIDDEGYPVYEEGYIIKKFPEGKATLLVEALTSELESFYYTVDFYVDNTAPVATLDGLDTRGDYNSVPVSTDGETVTLTGNVYDSAIDEMNELGMEFSIWEDGDIMPRTPDQGYNAVYALLDGAYYAADVDGESGDFTLTVPKDKEFLDIELYVIDGFSVRQFSRDSMVMFKIDPEFNPDVPCLGKILADTGMDYGFVGSNLTKISLTAEKEGAVMRLSSEPESFLPRDEKSFSVLFNGTAKAGGDKLFSAVIGNEKIANVSTDGNKITVKALVEGKTELVITSEKILVKMIPITVKPKISDGVVIEPGSKLYYGSMKHMIGAENIYESHGLIERVDKTFEEEATPILWNVMGSERLSENEYSKDISLFSEYIIDSIKFSDYRSFYTSEDDFETIRHYLNGGTYNGIDLETWELMQVNVESTFEKNFTGAELAAIPRLQNDIPLYSLDEFIPDMSFIADGDRFFLPWLAPHTINQFYQMDLISVFWNAGAGLYEDNALVYRESNLNDNLTDDSRLVATLKGGQPYGYWTETIVADWRNYTVGGEGDPLGTVFDIGLSSYDYCGVRPGMTLDPDSIVYAYKDQDGIYNLTVLGENEGESIGTLSGIPTNLKTTALGSVLALKDISASTSGAGYTISHKIVTDTDEPVVRTYGQTTATMSKNDITLATEPLEVGKYKVYLWLDKDNGINSNEAGVVYVLNLDVVPYAQYTVNFTDWDGTELKTETVDVGKSATAPENPSRDGYTFTGWDTDFDDVTSDLTVTAVYTKDTVYYSVVFKDWDGTELNKQTIAENSSATAPENPDREGYTFKGWDTDFDDVTSDLTVTAVYTKDTVYYSVVFKDWDGTELSKQTIAENSSATAPENPSRNGYTFKSWDKEFDNITADLTVTAVYTKNTVYYSVVFKDWDGTELNKQTIAENSSATAPENPSRNGYTFIGWDLDFENVTKDITVNALYVAENKTPVKMFDKAGNYDLKGEKFTGNYIISANGVTISNFNLNGDVIIKGKGATIKDATVNGSIVIEKEIGNDNAYINSVTTKKVNIKGGGSESIHITDSAVEEVVVDKEDNGTPVRVVSEGGTQIAKTVVLSSVLLENTTSDGVGGFGAVEMNKDIPASSTIVLTGAFKEIIADAPGITVVVQGTVETLTVSKTAENIKIEGDGEIAKAVIDESISESVNIDVNVVETVMSFTVTFVSNGGSAVDSAEVISGDIINSPANPTKSGFEFKGWYKDSNLNNLWNFSSDKVTANITLYAKWEAVTGGEEKPEYNNPGYVTVPQTTNTDKDSIKEETQDSEKSDQSDVEKEQDNDSILEDDDISNNISDDFSSVDGDNGSNNSANETDGDINGADGLNADKESNPTTGVAVSGTVVVISGLASLLFRRRKK